MENVSSPSTVYGSSGINPGNWVDRGTLWFSSEAASTVQKVQSYCKDIVGCGNLDYRSVSAAITLNYLDGCVPRLNGVMSLSGLFFKSASGDNLNEMYSMLIGSPAGQPGGAGLAAAAATVCNPFVTP